MVKVNGLAERFKKHNEGTESPKSFLAVVAYYLLKFLSSCKGIYKTTCRNQYQI
jgi:hypothetical protein